jgi:hypothetical protein
VYDTIRVLMTRRQGRDGDEVNRAIAYWCQRKPAALSWGQPIRQLRAFDDGITKTSGKQARNYYPNVNYSASVKIQLPKQ